MTIEKMNNKEAAALFCESIKKLAARPENLENLESYLSRHFETWLNKFAYDPENLACEMNMFASMDI